MIILNVGLKIDALGDEFNTDSICLARASLIQGYLVRLGYAPALSIRQSDTEWTVIIALSISWVPKVDIKRLSDMLGQDCIAVYNTCTENGELIGINADIWGEFNKDYFLMP